MEKDKHAHSLEHSRNYDIKVHCTNCGHGSKLYHNYTLTIPQGMLAIDYLKEYSCDKCGCLTLIKS